jgi:hypothetical protein
MKGEGGRMKVNGGKAPRLSSFILPPSSFDSGAGDEI